MNARNKLGNRIITAVINQLYKLRLKDSQTGFRAIRKSALDSLEMIDDGMPFASEMIIDARKKSMSIVEVPVSYRQRIGEAKLKAYKDGPLILTLIIRMVRDYNPFAIFLSVGALLILGSITVRRVRCLRVAHQGHHHPPGIDNFIGHAIHGRRPGHILRTAGGHHTHGAP